MSRYRALLLAQAILVTYPALMVSQIADANADTRLPTGQYITPLTQSGAIQQLLNPHLSDYPDFVAGGAVISRLSPDGTTLAVLCAGQNNLYKPDGSFDFSNQYVFLYDVSGVNKQQPKLIKVIKQANAHVGLVWTPDGSTFYATGGKDDAVYVYSKDGDLLNTIALGHSKGVGLSVLPNAGGLAILAGFMEFLPTVGPGIGIAISTTIAFFRGSTWAFFNNDITFALIVFVVANAITWLESAYLIPRLVGSRVRLHPAVTFVGVISGAIVFGLMGVLLATPVIASTRILLVYVFNKLTDREPFEMEGAPASTVRIRGLIGGRKIDGIIFDLDGTLTRIDFGAEAWVVQKTQWLDLLVNEERRRRATRIGMIRLESTVNFAINQLWRFEKYDTLRRLQPVFDHIRGYPSGPDLALQPGVEDTLRYLSAQYKLALITTRERETVEEFLVRACLDQDIFIAVIAREDVRNLVPNSEALMLAAQIMETEPIQTLIVSDGDPILRSGSATGMATAGVLSGLDREKDLASADLVLGTTAELTEWL
ncbi:MAG: AI-2E family transporter [Caldilineaceae bacterium]|nr:AI-2E family transporter [Caldilineaceae bacterium]